jgi:hypothetical protein
MSPNLLYAMANISTFVNVDWFIGLPFDDINNPRYDLSHWSHPTLTRHRHILAELSQKILGNRLAGMQLGNEPDLYRINGLRTDTYTPQDYAREWGQVLQGYKGNQNVPVTNNLIAPSVCCGGGPGSPGWTPEMVWETDFLNTYAADLKYISIEQSVSFSPPS